MIFEAIIMIPSFNNIYKTFYMSYRVFRIMDDNGDKQLTFAEFKKGLRDYGVIVEDVV